jgi:hypothetical protein
MPFTLDYGQATFHFNVNYIPSSKAEYQASEETLVCLLTRVSVHVPGVADLETGSAFQGRSAS